jgi:hypothetical protein
MTNNELFVFLGKCLSLGADQNDDLKVISLIKSGRVNWDRFVVLSSNHLVQPTLYLRFRKYGLLSSLPDEFCNYLKMVYELNYLRNSKILEQIDHINQLIASKNINPIYLKGAGNLLDHLYEDIGERMIGDIDILVSDEEFLPTVTLLKAEGYEHVHDFYEDQRTATKHFPRLVHPTELADIEIHRLPVDVKLSKKFNFQIIEKEKKRVCLELPCYVLSDKHNVILNFMHGFMSSEVQLGCRITYRNMVDFHLLSQRVNSFETLTHFPMFKLESRTYFDFVNRSMRIDNAKLPTSQSRWFIKKHKLYHNSKYLYLFVWFHKYMIYRFWNGYFLNCVGFIFNKQKRKSVIRRMTNPSWYVSHIKSYTTSFNENLS